MDEDEPVPLSMKDSPMPETRKTHSATNTKTMPLIKHAPYIAIGLAVLALVLAASFLVQSQTRKTDSGQATVQLLGDTEQKFLERYGRPYWMLPSDSQYAAENPDENILQWKIDNMSIEVTFLTNKAEVITFTFNEDISIDTRQALFKRFAGTDDWEFVTSTFKGEYTFDDGSPTPAIAIWKSPDNLIEYTETEYPESGRFTAEFQTRARVERNNAAEQEQRDKERAEKMERLNSVLDR